MINVENKYPEYNQRWIAYILDSGYSSPEEAKEKEKNQCGYINWISEKWAEFEKLMGCERNKITDKHNSFDKWLGKELDIKLI